MLSTCVISNLANEHALFLSLRKNKNITSGVGLQTEQVIVFLHGSQAEMKSSWNAGTVGQTRSRHTWRLHPGFPPNTLQAWALLDMLKWREHSVQSKPHCTDQKGTSPSSLLGGCSTLGSLWTSLIYFGSPLLLVVGIIWQKYSVSSYPFLWAELCPSPKVIVEFLAPSTSGCNLIWK